MPYTCFMCNKEFHHMKSYILHQYYHRNDPDVRFYCKYLNCQQEFVKYRNFRMHCYRIHVEAVTEIIQTYSCNVHGCSFQTESRIKLSSHMYKHINKGETVMCPYLNCLKYQHMYRSISALKSHLYRYHTTHETQQIRTVHSVCGEDCFDYELIQNQENSISPETLNSDSTFCKVFMKSLAGLYLNLQAKFFLTESALQKIIEGFTDINDMHMEHIKRIFKIDQQPNLVETLARHNLFNLAHNSRDGLLRTPYARKKYFKDNFEFVAPEYIKLGKTAANKDIFFVYVPILKTIEMLMRNSDVYLQWLDKKQSPSGIYADVVDGECFRFNTFFKDNPKGIQIVLYQDGFEVCNPLGSARKIHKITGIYMTLANLAPYCRSKVDQIQLVALCLESHVKQYGFNKIFEVIIKDVRYLENEGIKIASHELVKGTIIAVTGDNLGSHQIGGFAEKFSSTNNVCRYCYTSNMEISNYGIGIVNLRSPELYERDANIALTTDEITNGVKFNSILNECRYFKVCNPGMPPCLAHDIYEGILEYDFMLCINKLVSDHIFTYDFLNNRYRSLRLLHELQSENVPIIKKRDKLSGSASENLRTLLVFPFVVCDILTHDSCFKMIFLLRDITCILMAVQISSYQLAYLKYLITEYIRIRVEVFPGVKLRPKHHFLMHYPYLIKKFGPLRHLWTLRYESKHLYFKNILKHSPNFKNILYSLSEKHQLLQALHSTRGNLYTSKVAADGAIIYSPEDYEDKMQQVISTYCKFKRPKFISNKASFRGTTYCVGMLLCVRKTDFDGFVLCSVEYILINDDYSDIFFVGHQVLITLNDDTKLYENISLDKQNEQNVIGINFCDLLTHDPLMHYTNERDLYAFRSAPLEL